MTVKVSEVVIDALEELVVQADEAPIEGSEARAAIRALNDLMTAWEAAGIYLGYTEVDSLGDEMTVPPGSIRGIKAQLAIDLAPKYDVQIPPALLQKARDGYLAILNLTVNMAESEYPGTLPRGAGNDYPSYSDSTFYPDRQNTILTETGGSIALEDETEESG